MEVYNFDREEYELVEDRIEDWTRFLPRGAARNLYAVYLEMGDAPTVAAKKVLSKICDR